MNKEPLKTFGFWGAIIVAVLGVLLSQGVVVEGSTVFTIVGWLMSLIGSIGAGFKLGKPAEPNAT
jgi:hypothetical protein